MGFLVGRPDVKRSFRRPKQRLVDNIRINLTEIGWEGTYWVHMAEDRDQWWAFVNKVM